MPTCETCGGHVSTQFRAVFGDNNGVVYACYECSTRTGLLNGEGTTEKEPETGTETDHNEHSVSASVSDRRARSESGSRSG